MSQMDLLVTSVAELLTAAVQEVLQLMGQAVLEYQEESARARLENLSLQQKLKELQERTATASDEVRKVSFSRDDPRSLKDHPQEDLIYQEDSAVSEKGHPECLNDHPLHIKLVLDEITVGHQNKSLQVISEYSLKKQRPPSRPPQRSMNPSPGSRDTPATSNITTSPSPNRLKAESKPEPHEYSVTGDVTPHAPDVSMPPLENELNQQPVSIFSSNIIHYNQPSKFLDATSNHILRSRVENTVCTGGIHSAASVSNRPHGCHVCGKTFASASSLGAHFVCHSNERPFVCKCCNFRFSRLADLKKHERIHTGERPYNCSLCGRRFNRTENLRRHLSKVHYGAVL